MDAKIITVPERKLAGKKIEMTFARNQTADLWRSFMPQRNSLESIGDVLFSIAVYPEYFFRNFDATAVFEKWAAVEVASFDSVPGGWETLIIPSGTYAVFHYVGSSADAREIFGYIFNDWLPQSGYKLDNRPHFEILGAKYKNNDSASEEDIYIPIS
jgi:AraC family transcriptional regulator